MVYDQSKIIILNVFNVKIRKRKKKEIKKK